MSSLNIILFIFGATIGSFLNVVALRYQEDGPLFTPATQPNRSFCPHCKKILRWYELVPIASFFMQGGRCRTCAHQLSWQYPIVELMTGLFLAILPAFHGNFIIPELIIIGLAGITFLLLALIDTRLMVIPDQLNVFLGILGVALIGVGTYTHRAVSFVGSAGNFFGTISNPWLNHALAGIVGGAIFGAIVLLTQGKAMGMGDVKLAAALGILVGWPAILMVVFLSFTSGALYATGLLITKRKSMKDMVPFGPFLVFSAIVTMLSGSQLLNAYFKLFI